MKPWDFGRFNEREKAEEFYLANRRPNELPFEFCIRYFGYGLDRTAEVLDKYFQEVDVSTLPAVARERLEAANKLLTDFWPIQDWLTSTWRNLRVSLR